MHQSTYFLRICRNSLSKNWCFLRKKWLKLHQYRLSLLNSGMIHDVRLDIHTWEHTAVKCFIKWLFLSLMTNGLSISLGGSWHLADSSLGPPMEKSTEKPHAELSAGSSGRRLLGQAAMQFTAKNICPIGKSLKCCKISKGSHKSLSADFLLSKKHIAHGWRELELIIYYLMPLFSNVKNQYVLSSMAIC